MYLATHPRPSVKAFPCPLSANLCTTDAGRTKKPKQRHTVIHSRTSFQPLRTFGDLPALQKCTEFRIHPPAYSPALSCISRIRPQFILLLRRPCNRRWKARASVSTSPTNSRSKCLTELNDFSLAILDHYQNHYVLYLRKLFTQINKPPRDNHFCSVIHSCINQLLSVSLQAGLMLVNALFKTILHNVQYYPSVLHHVRHRLCFHHFVWDYSARTSIPWHFAVALVKSIPGTAPKPNLLFFLLWTVNMLIYLCNSISSDSA